MKFATYICFKYSKKCRRWTSQRFIRRSNHNIDLNSIRDANNTWLLNHLIWRFHWIYANLLIGNSLKYCRFNFLTCTCNSFMWFACAIIHPHQIFCNVAIRNSVTSQQSVWRIRMKVQFSLGFNLTNISFWN